MEDMTYAGAGVNYDFVDAFKREALAAARETMANLPPGFKPVEWAHGEATSLIETPWGGYMGLVVEGLGTKNLVADALVKQVIAADMKRLLGRSFYPNIPHCAVAAIVNDMITLGTLPVLLGMHLAVGTGGWFKDQQRRRDLITGWQKACQLAGCYWCGGETPVLCDMVNNETAVVSGAAVGFAAADQVIKPNIQDGDAIVMIMSSGIHANGLTLARRIAEGLPRGYLTELPNDRTLGEELLQPTIIYVPFIRECLTRPGLGAAAVHYVVPITGHGWPKLMRAVGPGVCIIDWFPPPPCVFTCLQEWGGVGDEEAFATWNMGAGLAVMAPEDKVPAIMKVAQACQLIAWRAGHVEKKTDEKKVVIVRPIQRDITYGPDDLAIR